MARVAEGYVVSYVRPPRDAGGDSTANGTAGQGGLHPASRTEAPQSPGAETLTSVRQASRGHTYKDVPWREGML